MKASNKKNRFPLNGYAPSRKQPAAAAAEAEEDVEKSEQDGVTDGEPDGDDEVSSGSGADADGVLVPATVR